jgi:orotate phosphoribosyltransferase
MQDLKNQSLVEIVKQNAIRFGECTLSSGMKSGYFVEMSKVCNRSDALDMITLGILLHLDAKNIKIDSVGGPELGVAPVVGGLMTAFQRHFYSTSILRGFMVRKEPKNGDLIEGDLRSGDRVLVVEDVITTGRQVKRACDTIEARGGKIQMIIGIVDRLAGGAETLAKWPYASMMTVQDLGVC